MLRTAERGGKTVYGKTLRRVGARARARANARNSLVAIGIQVTRAVRVESVRCAQGQIVEIARMQRLRGRGVARDGMS